MISAGALLGVRGGLLMGFLSLPLNASLHVAVGATLEQTLIQDGGAIEVLALLLIGGTIGHLRDLLVRTTTLTAHINRLGHVLEHASDEIYLCDPMTLRLVEANSTACRNLGYPMDHLVTCSLHDLVPEACIPGLLEAIARVCSGSASEVVLDTVFRRANGLTYDVETHLRLVNGHPASFLVVSVQDVTVRKLVERRIAALSALGLQLSATTSTEAAARIIADTADALLGWDAFVLSVYDPVTGTVSDVLSFDIVDGQRSEIPVHRAAHPPSILQQRTITEGALLLLPEHESAFDDEAISSGDINRSSASLMFVSNARR